MNESTNTTALPSEMVRKATEAAMRDAVKAGLVPKYDDMDSTVKHWDGMAAVVRAALTAADVPGLVAEVERLRGEVAWLAKQIASDNQTALALKKEADAAEDRAYKAEMEYQRVIDRAEKAERERDEAREALDACVNCFECENTLSNAVIEQARRVLGSEAKEGGSK